MAADGKIVIDAEITKDKANRDLADIEKSLSRLQRKVQDIVVANESAFGSGLQSKAQRMTQTYARQVDAIRKQEAAIAQLQRKQEALAKGTPGTSSVEKQLAREEEKLRELEAVWAELAERQELELSVDTKFQHTETIAEIDNQFLELGDQITAVEDKIRALKESLAAAPEVNPLESVQGQKLAEDLDLAMHKLTRLQDEAAVTEMALQRVLEPPVSNDGGPLQQLLSQLNQTTAAAATTAGQTGSMLDSIGRKLDAFKSRMTKLMLSTFVFNVIRRGLLSVQKAMTAALMKNAAFTASLKSIKSSLATAFAPIYNAALPAINALMRALSSLAALFANVMSFLFGTTVSGANAAASALNNQAGAYGGAGDAAKKAAKQVAAFDDVNVIESQDTGSGGGGGGGGSAAIGEVQELSPALQSILEKIQQLIAPLKNIDFTNLINAFNNLKAALAPFARNLFEGLEWAWFNLFVPLAQWTIEDALPAFLNLLAAAITVLNSVVEALKPLALWLWESFLQPIAEWTGGAIISAIEWLTEKLYAFSDWIDNNQETVQRLATTILMLTAGFLLYHVAVGLVNTAVNLFSAAMTLLTNPITWVILAVGLLVYAILWLIDNWELVKEKAVEVWDKIVETWEAVCEWFETNVITPVRDAFDAAWEAITGFFETAWETIRTLWDTVFGWFQEFVVIPVRDAFDAALTAISGFFSSAWAAIDAIWTLVKGWFDTHVINPVRNAFRLALAAIKGFFSSAWTGIRNVWDKVVGWFEKHVINPIQTAFDAVATAIKTVLNGVIGFVNGMISGIETAVNWVIDKMNTISWKAPDWAGGKTFGFNIANVSFGRIPELATGAVIPPGAEFLALLGDQKHGRNLEAPESLIRQIVREESGAGANNGPAPIIIRADGNVGQLIRFLRFELEREERRTGKSLVVGMETQ